MTDSILHYVADPMCSWCWGFAATLAAIESRLVPSARVQLVLGGLAPDSDQPMDDATKVYVQQAWRAVAAASGAVFEHEFWQRCQPRRSTWPACRAVLAAGEHGRAMFAAIQRAYYLEARNPSDAATLIELAGELGLDVGVFAERLDSDATRAQLAAQFELRDRLGAQGFPTLVLQQGERVEVLARGFVQLVALEPLLQDRGLRV